MTEIIINRITQGIIIEIMEERQRQDEKWGVQDHGPSRWSDILMEEVGETSRAILEHCGPGSVINPKEGLTADVVPFNLKAEQEVRKELIQVVAVGLAWIECIDRRAGK